MFTLCSCQRSPLLLKCPLGRGEFLLSARVLTAGPRMRDACAVKETRRRRPSWHRVKAAGPFGKSNLENRMISVTARGDLPRSYNSSRRYHAPISHCSYCSACCFFIAFHCSCAGGVSLALPRPYIVIGLDFPL